MATGAINFTGFNGIDFTSIVEAIMTQESLPLKNMQKSQTAMQAKDAALAQLGTQIGKLQTAAKDLAARNIFADIAATSSDTSILTTTKGSDAIAGSYEIEVTNLAKAQVTGSTNGYTAISDVAADGGSIAFSIDGETTGAIEITKDTTLAELRSLINKQNSGVVASIVNNGITNKLVISSRTTGEENGFVINNSLSNSGGNAVAFARGQSTTVGNSQDARNAELKVNGIDIVRASNTITGAVPGIAMNLFKKGSASLEVTPNYDTLKGTVQTLVSEYNKLRDFYTRQSANDSAGNRGPLASDSVMRQALSDIRSTLMGSNTNGGRYHYLSEIGLELTARGTLSFTESKFNAAVADYPADLAKLFQGSTGNGVFDTLKKRLDNLDATAGLIKTTRTALDETLDRYRDRIDNQQKRLELRRAQLKKVYGAAEAAMTRIGQSSSSLASLSTQSF